MAVRGSEEWRANVARGVQRARDGRRRRMTAVLAEWADANPALRVRLHPVTLEAASAEETRAILQRHIARYETHHRVRYDARALEAVIQETDGVLPTHPWPEKALRLADLAGARAAPWGKRKHATVTRTHVKQALAGWVAAETRLDD